MSEYEELVERCFKVLWTDGRYNGVEAILAEVLRTLETVTPEMEEASDDVEEPGEELWLAMLRASPLKSTDTP